jgi:putative ABC transport system permease protein
MLQDLRRGFRSLRKSPAFTIAAIAMLAVAIAADCVVFSVADAVLFRPLPYKDPDRLQLVFCGQKGKAATWGPSVADFLDWKDRNHVFEDIALTGGTGGTIKIGDYPESWQGLYATTNLFDLLGVTPLLGRTFRPEEAISGRESDVAMVGYDFWQGRLRGDPGVLGRSFETSGGHKVTVIGVLPPGFRFDYSRKAQLWYPMATPRGGDRSASPMQAIARLKPGVTPAQAQAAMRGVLADIARDYPASNRDRLEVNLVSIRGWVTRQVRPIMFTLLGAVTFVLLIGCANVANLMLARLTDRERETTLRAALGAARWRLAREFLTESLLVALAAGGLGLLLSSWGLEALRSQLPPQLPRGNEVRLDAAVVWFALAASLFTTLAFGLLPALKFSNVHLIEELASASATLGGRRGKGMRSWLIAAETALALVLTGGAGLMMNSFIRLMHVDLGFNPRHAMVVHIVPDTPGTHGLLRSFDPEMEAIRAVPGVRQAAATDLPPLLGGDCATYVRPAPDAAPLRVRCKTVAGDFFGTVQTPLLAGRVFTPQDSPESERVVMINQALARLLYPGGGALGRQAFGMGPSWGRVVGVVADARDRLLFAAEPTLYIAGAQKKGFPGLRSVVVRYDDAGREGLIAEIRRRIEKLDPGATLTFRSFEDAISEQGAQVRFLTLLMTGAGALGLLLSAGGIFGVTAYAVNRRTRELGVRMALGAAPGDVLRMIAREGVVSAAAGAAIGTVAVFALRSVLRNLLFEVSPGDPLTLAAVVFVLAAVSATAGYIPARRALSIDPAVALRYE